ncbi:hypothetical protein GSI_02784 [Ganoderma sinense ZZ0214-1]|uniref:RNA-directed DNA polymerase n=1 Tax=Ganoderma sinense ZZ0214-1 TaxID=1077348 RepID=A0A2G8SMK0_9APHY|nr:hypothetical protein GSI_02784 [Ganoderma sinense ZZ0214-1]
MDHTDAPTNTSAATAPNPSELLAAHLPTEVYQALEHILRDLDQRVSAPQPAPPPALTTDDFRRSLEQAFASANFTIQTTVPVPMTTAPVQPRPGTLKVEAPHFHGKETKDIGAWLSLTEDYLHGQHIPEADWLLQVPMLFRNEVLRCDRLANFLVHLPPEQARDICRDNPKNVEEIYFSARQQKKQKHRSSYSLFPSLPTPTAAAPTTSTSSSDPQPMDLDAMETQLGLRGAKSGSQPGSTKGLHLLTTVPEEDESGSEKEEGESTEEESVDEYKDELYTPGELHVFSLEDGEMSKQELPVYYLQIPSNKNTHWVQLYRTASIIDTGAACCYLKPSTAHKAGINLFPITKRLVRGAGQTTTSNLGRFRVKLGGIVRPMLAYVLDDDRLRYDLVIGLDWLRRHNAQPEWNTNVWFITDKDTAQTAVLTPSSSPDSVWSLPSNRPPHRCCKRGRCHSAAFPMALEMMAMIEEVDETPPHQGPKKRLAMAAKNLGERIRSKAKEKFPWLFCSKVKYDEIPKGRVTHTIDTRDAQPVRARGRPHSPPEHEEVCQFMEDGLRDGIIEPSESPWSAPIIFAKKKDGTNRICVDYRRLNAVTVKNAYPLPRIDDTYQHLHGARFFTMLDLKSGYWQIPIDPASWEKTAFEMRYGQYQFRVMEFGLCNAPATFQRFMNNVLRPYLDRCAMVYLDDIIIYSPTEQQHVQDVMCVLSALHSNSLVLNEKKCRFASPKIEYLGHIISVDGVRPEPKKVAAITDWPVSDNGFARAAGPLYELLKGSPHKGAPVQCYPRPWHLFVINTDASGDAIGGILHQSDKDFREGKEAEDHFCFKESMLHPIAYKSCQMTPTEQRYSAQEREMLAIDYCLQKWHGYVEGSPIIVRTDHESLKYFLTQKHLGRRLARFADNIMHFNVKIVYRPGRNQLAADALSRCPGHTDVPNSETLGSLFAHPLDSSAAAPATTDLPDEPAFRTLEIWRCELVVDSTVFPAQHGFVAQGGLLWRCRHNRAGEVMVRVPTTLTDARAVIRDVHQEIGHLGVHAVTDALQSRVWIPFLMEHVRDVVSRCNSCQFTRREAPKPGPLHPLPRVDTFDCWAFDWIGPLHKSQRGNEYILTSIDHSTDLTYATAHPRRSHEAVLQLLCQIITSHGKLKTVLTNNGEEFLTYAFQNYLHHLGIKHLHTTPYHPQTNGRLEKFNDNFVQTLARYIAPDHQDKWDNYVPDALLAHRAHVNSSTGASSAFLTYGRELRLPTEVTYDTLQRPPTDEEIEALQRQRLEHVQNLERFHAEANAKGLQHLEKEASKRENTYHDRALDIGDLVLRRSENPTKLHPRWDGPFIIQDLTDRNTYQLHTCNGYVLRTLYNGERLKRYKPSEPEPNLWYSSAELQRCDAKACFECDLRDRRAG